MEFNQFDFMHVIDLECTCCNQNSFPREEMEIIEIGVVTVDLSTQAIITQFDEFAKPIINPDLTDFCMELTSISQCDVDNAEALKAVMEYLSIYLSKFPNACWGSWGQFDCNKIKQECTRKAIQNPLHDIPHINLKYRFEQNAPGKSKRQRGFGLGRALKLMNLKFEGTQHRAIDDVKNICQLLPYIIK